MTGFDVAVIGGGIVGLATARALRSRLPGARLVVLEKEGEVGIHQTSRNSGVLHTGIYYRPDSLKARLCVEGRAAMLAYCAERGIPVALSGKVIVAAEEDQLPSLAELADRGRANGVEGVTELDPAELKQVEPAAAGIAALHIPSAGTVDFGVVARSLAAELAGGGVSVWRGRRLVGSWRDGIGIRLELSTSESVRSRVVVSCAGLHADRVAVLLGVRPSVGIVPFRGEYWSLRRPELVRSMIYPVPDPRLPFLGIHFTRRIDRTVEVGPSALLALAREGYGRGKVRPRDLWEILRTPGVGRLAARYWRTGLSEAIRSWSALRLLAEARRLVPSLHEGDLVRRGSGVRAQAVAPDGTLVDDFVIEEGEHVIAVLNAPSPAATASLAIGEKIAELAARRLS